MPDKTLFLSLVRLLVGGLLLFFVPGCLVSQIFYQRKKGFLGWIELVIISIVTSIVLSIVVGLILAVSGVLTEVTLVGALLIVSLVAAGVRLARERF